MELRNGRDERRRQRLQPGRDDRSHWFGGGGRMGDLVRAHDWAATPLGPVSGWPPPLRTALAIVLRAAVPMAVCWGPEFRWLCNDGFAALVGGAHRAFPGQPAREAVPGLWPAIADTLAGALAGRAGQVRDQPLARERDSHADDARMDLDFSPIPLDDGLVGGVLVVATEAMAAEGATRALRESEARLRLAQEAAGIGVYERDLETGRSRWSPDMFRVWGIDARGRSPWVSDDEYMSLVVRDDHDRHRARRNAQRADPNVLRFEYEYRIRRADTGQVRWISSRGEYVRDATGRAVLVRGTNHDVTERRAAEERHGLLMREVDHRAKNALAIVQSVVRLTRAADPEAFKAAVLGRVSALARAQTLLAGDRWSGADLRTLLHGELAPFRGAGQRVTLIGPDLTLPPVAAQPLAMAAHELATNALKYGALSAPDGRVSVAWDVVEDRGSRQLRLHWAESGGPPVTGPPSRRGFGTRVLDGTVRHQLGGVIALSWAESGLVCDVTVPLAQ